jgi:hypothetical protein
LGLAGRDWLCLGAVELGFDCLRLRGLPVTERTDFERVCN